MKSVVYGAAAIALCFVAPVSAQTEAPRLLRMKLSMQHPSELQVGAGDRVEAGQVLIDRSQEREALADQLIALDGEASVFVADIEKAERALAIAENDVAVQLERIAYFSTLPALPELVMQHERSKLMRLRDTADGAELNLKVARAKLNARRQELTAEMGATGKVTAPFDGTIRNMRWEGQTNEVLTVELTITSDRVGSDREDDGDGDDSNAVGLASSGE